MTSVSLPRYRGHAPGVAGGTHATALAGVGDQEIVLALVAVGSGEAVGEDAAFEIAAKGALDMGRWCFTVLSAGEFQPGCEVGLGDAIAQCPLGTEAVYIHSYWVQEHHRSVAVKEAKLPDVSVYKEAGVDRVTLYRFHGQAGSIASLPLARLRRMMTLRAASRPDPCVSASLLRTPPEVCREITN